MLRIVKPLHEGMQVEVRVGASLSDSFEVWNGLCQGCTQAPALFNIYFSAGWQGGGIAVQRQVWMFCSIMGSSWLETGQQNQD